MNVELIPAIMPKNFEDLKDKLALVVGHVPVVQIDVMDGLFTNSKSWPYFYDVDFDFEKIVSQEEGFPFWEEINFEVDLMVKNPETLIEKWADAGAVRIIIHNNSFKTADDFLAIARSIHDRSIECVLAIHIDDSLDIISQVINELDAVQFMGINHVGFQGQEFNPDVIEKITACKKLYPSLPVSVDGGVSLETAAQLISVGVDRLVSGSAIFENSDIEENLENFKAIVG